VSDVLSSITESMIRDGIDREFFARIYHLKNEDLKNLDYCIRKLQAGWKNVSFLDLPFHEKREFLLGRVLKIKYDFIHKALSIEFKPEDEEPDGDDLYDEYEEITA